MPAAENASRQIASIRFSVYHDAEPLGDEDLDARGLKPAREYPHFRFWQDRHNPERVATFEESRRRWHERNDPPAQS